MALTPGTCFGPYEIAKPIGAGGMGEVWRAKDTNLKRDVALKVLPEAFVEDSDRLARFQLEAEILASLNHPNIAQVYGLERGVPAGTRGTSSSRGDDDSAESAAADKRTAIIMELVEGPTLADRIAAGPIPADEARQIAMQITEALEAAHGKQIIHRDLKPANIKLTPDGLVKLLDFGIAGMPEPAGPASGGRTPTLLTPALTEVGVLLGTAAYMSPEQAKGQLTDQRADIWAFGCVLYEMLTGQPAFGGEDVTTTLARILEREPNLDALPGSVPPALAHTIRLCLEKDPRDRIRHIGDVRLALQGRLGTGADPGTATAETPVSWRRLAVSIIATAVIAAGVTASAALLLRPASEPRPLNRLAHAIPPAVEFRRFGRPVLALSPDGRAFAYNTTDGLYLRRLDQLDANVIPGTEEDLAAPFFSPDSQAIAYWQSGELIRMPVTGGAPTVLAAPVEIPWGASWHADNTIYLGQTDGIYRVNGNGGELERVIAREMNEQLSMPRLLPDGDTMLFAATGTIGDWNESIIYAQSISAGERTAVVRGGRDPRYLPSGHLIFALQDRLVAATFDPATGTVSGGQLAVAQSLGAGTAIVTGAANYDVADDGTLIYLTGENINPADVVWIDAATGAEQETAGLPIGAIREPALSPDETRLALRFGASSTDRDIVIWSFAQRALTRLSLEGGRQDSPIWIDNDRIAYETVGGGLFLRRADGTGAPEPIHAHDGNIYPDTVAGDELLFSVSDSDGDYDIWARPLDGSAEARPVLDEEFDERQPAISPDGRWLAYVSRESGQDAVFVRPYPRLESGKWQISTDGGDEPRWAVDDEGLMLFYSGPDAIMRARVSAGSAFTSSPPEPVVPRGPYLYVPGVRNYEVTADGSRLLLFKRLQVNPDGTEAGRSQVVIVQNFDEELKRLLPVD